MSSVNVSSTPILVTTPSSDSKPSFNDHRDRRDDSSDDQRHLNKQNSNKTYTRVGISIDSPHKMSYETKLTIFFIRVTVIKTNN